MVHISYVSLSGTEGLPPCLWALSKVFQNLDYLHWLKMHFLFHFQGFFTKFVLKLWAQYLVPIPECLQILKALKTLNDPKFDLVTPETLKSFLFEQNGLINSEHYV